MNGLRRIFLMADNYSSTSFDVRVLAQQAPRVANPLRRAHYHSDRLTGGRTQSVAGRNKITLRCQAGHVAWKLLEHVCVTTARHTPKHFRSNARLSCLFLQRQW